MTTADVMITADSIVSIVNNNCASDNAGVTTNSYA